MRVLMVGDVVGRPGRDALQQLLPELRTSLSLDRIIVNGENAAAGRGLTEQIARQMLRLGVDVITSGNHIFDVREFVPSLDNDWPVLRPANYPPGTPGRGMVRLDGLTVINLMGRTFMPMPLDDPFRVADELLEQVPAGDIILVDFHAEATSEKQAIAWYLDGRVAAVVGTHTHVPTADTRILPGGTAACTDLGMVGARDSIIGDDVNAVLQRFLTSMPTRLPVAEGPEVTFNGVVIEIDEQTQHAISIERVDRECLLRN
ncbi:MAG: TIGR00282 family metallophosphoesterase [Chloroflexota bacterium]